MRVLILYTLRPEEVPVGRAGGEFDLIEAAEEIAPLLPGAEIAGVH